MELSETDICNMALKRIGAKALTDLEDDTSVEALHCQLQYPIVRDSLLESFIWPFAIKRETLGLLYTLTLDSGAAAADFVAGAVLTGATSGKTCTVVSKASSTAYTVSKTTTGNFTDGEVISDGVNSRDCGAGYPILTELEVPEFQYGHNYPLPTDFLRKIKVLGDGRYKPDYSIEGLSLLSNHMPINLEYVAFVNDTDEFPPLFVKMLVLSLAVELISPLAGTGGEAERLRANVLQELELLNRRARSVYRSQDKTGASKWNSARYGSGLI